ncbi:hypothetical protein [Cohnella sp.]|uniref:hypothetical protein n=1 Tax=Cohnella sp. TaxID=1883426 RepID=UPI00356A0EF2
MQGYRVRMFDKFDLTEDERSFVENVDAGGSARMSSAEVHAILADFYHAKQIEQSAKSNDRSSRIMTWLTVAIVTFTAVQGVSALLQYLASI